jgi:hypothetical protein
MGIHRIPERIDFSCHDDQVSFSVPSGARLCTNLSINQIKAGVMAQLTNSKSLAVNSSVIYSKSRPLSRNNLRLLAFKKERRLSSYCKNTVNDENENKKQIFLSISDHFEQIPSIIHPLVSSIKFVKNALAYLDVDFRVASDRIGCCIDLVCTVAKTRKKRHCKRNLQTQLTRHDTETDYVLRVYIVPSINRVLLHTSTHYVTTV